MQHICTRVAEEDPATAIRLAIEHELDAAPGDFIGGLTTAWAGRDLQSARRWVEAQPEGELRDGLISIVAFELAKSAPAKAAMMVAEQMAAGEIQLEAAISVLHQWMLRDPEAAARWVGAFPNGKLKERASHELWPDMGVRDGVE
ncbi:MAG: hypothetical protein EOP88_11145 [Verrucomicrobiaceae bacterium]|nr:MAG: hypothetical protein EOP88_11145 [Verrucomicrobiaceae bacterium]